MKIANPYSRQKIKIPSGANVLDVGSGHNPHPRANVVTDKFIDSNYHRSANLKVLQKQRFVEADGENMPFKDKEFDYVICCHVVEHVENPAKFLDELSRVGKSGYLEAPSLVGEFLVPKESHKWVLLDIDNKVVLVDKKKIGLTSSHDFGDMFLTYLPKHSIGYKILQRTQPQLFTINYEWKDKIDYIVEPTDEMLRQYFTRTWDKQMFDRMVPNRSMSSEFMAATGAMWDIMRSVFRSKVLKKN